MVLTKQELAPTGGDTYDTRPMSEDGSRLSNVAALADEAGRVDLVVPVHLLARIAPELASSDGAVTASVALGREQGRIVAEVQLAADLQVLCQRCLTPMPLPVASRSRVLLLESESQAGEAPPEMEIALAPEGRLRLAELVEEELLLALPAAPKHSEGQCPERTETEDFSEPTQRPFATLGAMLKSGRSKQ